MIGAHYRDFGSTLASEKLAERHGIKLCVESTRQIMMTAGYWQTRKGVKVCVHPMRERRACLGELIQTDGSPHDWFEGRGERCTLLVFRINAKEANLEAETQFGRAARELGIECIHPNSPQAKGRVERANQTLQKRLVKEMRLTGIADMASANAWLPGFIADYNRRFASDTQRPTKRAYALSRHSGRPDAHPYRCR